MNTPLALVAEPLSRGLVEEQTVETTAKADPALKMLWRSPDDGRGTLLRITPAGLDPLGIEADSAAVAATEVENSTATTEASAAAEAGLQAAPAARSGKNREGTEQALLVEMRTPRGREHRRDCRTEPASGSSSSTGGSAASPRSRRGPVKSGDAFKTI